MPSFLQWWDTSWPDEWESPPHRIYPRDVRESHSLAKWFIDCVGVIDSHWNPNIISVYEKRFNNMVIKNFYPNVQFQRHFRIFLFISTKGIRTEKLLIYYNWQNNFPLHDKTFTIMYTKNFNRRMNQQNKVIINRNKDNQSQQRNIS